MAQDKRPFHSDALPRPWFVDDVGSTATVRVFSGDPRGNMLDWQEVALCGADESDGISLQTARANAELIAQCANERDALIDAARYAARVFGSYLEHNGTVSVGMEQAVERLRLALGGKA